MAWGRLRTWTPIFLGRSGNRPLSLSAVYRSVLHEIRTRQPKQRRMWRTVIFGHCEAISTIVRSLLNLLLLRQQSFYRRRLPGESQAHESSDTEATLQRITKRVGPPARTSRAMSYLLPSPLKPLQRSETQRRESSGVSQNPSGGDGVQRCGIGCQCSRCFYYGGLNLVQYQRTMSRHKRN